MTKFLFRSVAFLTLVMSLLFVSSAHAGWVSKSVNASTTFLGVDFASDGRRGLAVGTGGIYATTFDGGRTWVSNKLTISTDDLQDVVYLPGSTTAVAVGNNGTVLKFTLNGDGSSYSVSNFSISGTDIMNSVSFGDAQNGWMVTNNGRIYRTTDGGHNWVQQINPVAQSLKRVRAVNVARAWAVGANGAVLFTSDGINWTAKISGTSSSLYDISFVGSTLLAVGGDRTMLKSTDDGTTWNVLAAAPVASDIAYFRVRATDVNNIYVSGTKGVFIFSANGGNSWQDLSDPAQNYFYGLAYIKPELQIVVGTNSRILLYDTGRPSVPANFTVDPSGAVINDSTPTLSWSASSDLETNVASYEMSVNNGAYADIGNVLSKTISTLGEGANTIYVRAKDEGGNTSDVGSANFVVDTTGPTVGAITPVSAQTGVTAIFSVSASDTNGMTGGIADCHLFVNGSDRGAMSYSVANQTFVLGYIFYDAATNQMTALCTDSVGNKAAGVITYVTVSGVLVTPPPGSPAGSSISGAPSGGSTGGSSGLSGNFVTAPSVQFGVTSGALIKLQCADNAGVNDPCRAVYFVGADNKRHAFPNDKVYFTWYTNFSGVQIVNAEKMASFMLGKNIVYRPGVKMVKFMTDLKVYAVAKSGVLRWVSSEAVAKSLYGDKWAKKVDDVSDAFAGDYIVGAEVTVVNGFNPAAESLAVQTLSQN